jgi:hypothetical protein
MDEWGEDRPALVEVRPATVGWKARPCVARSPLEDRSLWRPTKRWAVRAVGRSIAPAASPADGFADDGFADDDFEDGDFEDGPAAA